MAFVIIIGAGKLGYYLSRTLIRQNYEVLLMEKNPVSYRRISMDLGDVAMLGDGTSPTVLKTAGIQRADVVVAATGDDEDNIVICQMASHCFKKKRIIARVNNPANDSLFEHLGIHERLSGTNALLRLLSPKVSRETLIPLGALERSNIEIVELILEEDSTWIGQPLRALVLPEEGLIVSILRGNHAVIPTAEIVFESGDIVIALIPTEREAELRATMTSTRGDES